MKHVEFGFEVFVTEKRLIEYTEKIQLQQQSSVEWRFPSYTAMNGEQSFVARIFNQKIQSYLLVPHFWNIPQKKKSIVRKKQHLHELIRKGLQKKVHLYVTKWHKVQTILVPNTNLGVVSEMHEKHLVDILEYGKYDWKFKDYEFFETDFTPIWVHKSIMPFIFKKVSLFQGEEKRHAQYEPYCTFSESSNTVL